MQVVNLDELKRHGALWQGRRAVLAAEAVLPSGWRVLDDLLGGGWPRAALTELLGEPQQGLPLLLPLLSRLSRESRWLAWVAPPYVPYAPALAARGLNVRQVLLVQDVAQEQRLWAAEQALKSGACSAVLLWPEVGKQGNVGVNQRGRGRSGGIGAVHGMAREKQASSGLQTAQLRRLQLAAEQGNCVGVLFRSARAAGQSSPAALRLRLRPAPLGIEVEVLKRRGAWGGSRCMLSLSASPSAARSHGGQDG